MNLYALVRPFLAMAVLRAAPQDLPHSMLLLALSALAYLVLGVVSYATLYSAGAAVILSLADLALVSALVSATLATHGLTARIAQTLTAVLGTGAVMAVLVLPALGWIAGGQELRSPGAARIMAILALTVWGLTVNGHILRHALSSAMALGMAFSLLYFFITFYAMRALRVSLGIE